MGVHLIIAIRVIWKIRNWKVTDVKSEFHYISEGVTSVIEVKSSVMSLMKIY